MLHGRNSNVRPFAKEIVSTFLPTAIVCLMQVCPAEQPNKGNVRWLLRTELRRKQEEGPENNGKPATLVQQYCCCPISAALILQCVALADTAAKYCNRVLKPSVFAIPCIN